jgi:hypothetical protein
MSNNKFESLLELLINEENDKAEALFHEIVVEKSRDIYENLADESTEDKVEETAEESKEDAKVDETTEDEAVDEASEEAKSDEQVDEVVEIEDEATESETTEEETIEEVGGDATDELVKDISADQEGEHDAMDKPDMDMDMDMDKDAEGDAEGDVEDRVVDLEDALDELKAEFEAMMGDKKDGEDKEDESLEMPAVETQPEMSYEAKHMKAKETVKEYKNPVKADHADHSDKAAKGATPTVGGAKVKTGASGSNIAQAQADSGNSSVATPQKIAGEFENTGGKAKSTSFKKAAPKAATADVSDKSAKSTISGK